LFTKQAPETPGLTGRLRAALPVESDPRAWGGTLASVLMIAAATMDLVGLIWDRHHLTGRVVDDLAAYSIAGIVLLVPWTQFTPRAMFAIIPAALGLIAAGATFGGMEPFSFTAYMMLFFAWVGATFPRGIALKTAPLSAAAFLIPVFLSDMSSSAQSAAVVIPIGVLVGETIAWGAHRLRSSEERKRMIVELVSDVAFVVRFNEDGTTATEWLTDPFSRLLGLEDGDDTWLSLINREDVLALEDAREELRLGRINTVEFRIDHPKLGLRWFERVARPMLDDDGAVIGYLGSAKDITERKLSEQERHLALQRALDAAEHLRVLEGMKASFVTAASHELRTSVTSIIGIARTLEHRRDQLSPAEQLDLIRRLASNGERLEQMFRELMAVEGDAAPQSAGTRASVQLRTLVDNAVRTIDFGSHHLAAIDVSDAAVSLDGASFQRILTTLLCNAVQHTKPDAHIWLRLHLRGDRLELTVDDDGHGIAENMKQQIFKPFAANGAGGGVGLSLVDRFANLLEGRAWVEDRPGGGARFRVSIPAKAEASVGARTA
jgi:signal transduction histidine kinase